MQFSVPSKCLRILETLRKEGLTMFLLHKMIGWIKILGRRKRRYLIPLMIWSLLLLVALSWSDDVSRALEPPPPPDQNLDHFRRSADLKHYLDKIQVLIEPSSPCDGDVPILILVTSTPSHMEQRQAIRSTWGQYQPTYFVMALEGQDIDERMVDNYIEAKQYADMIIFDMLDHYQNLTLKTALMLQWTLDRCPHAQHLMKTDDDVVINPWTLGMVIEEHGDAKLLGYRVNNTKLHRDEYSKWFVPRWLYMKDVIPQYLSGTGYIINGKYLKEILEAAIKTPLVNLEDVYLTYLVSNTVLKYDLTHDRRLSPFRPWLPLNCAYWTLASFHSLKPNEVVHAWARITRIAKQYEHSKIVCSFYRRYVESELLLY